MNEGSVLSKSDRQKKLLELLMPQGSKDNQLFEHVTQAYVAENLGVSVKTIKADVAELKAKGYDIECDHKGMIIYDPIHELNLKLTTTELVTLFEALCVGDQFEQVTGNRNRPQLLHREIIRGIAKNILKALEPQKMITKDKESGEPIEIENNRYAENRIKEVLINSYAPINSKYNIECKRFFRHLQDAQDLKGVKNRTPQFNGATIMDAVKGQKILWIKYDGKKVAARAKFKGDNSYELRTADEKAEIIGCFKEEELIAIVDKVEGSR